MELLGLETCQKMDPDRVYMYCGGFAPWTVADMSSLTLTLTLTLALTLTLTFTLTLTRWPTPAAFASRAPR